MTPRQSVLPLVAVLALLAGAALLTVVSKTLTGGDVYGLVTVLAGGTAVAGGLALSSSTANIVPHVVLIVAVVGLTVAMALEHVFGSVEVQGVFEFILGGGSVGAGSNIVTMRLRRQKSIEDYVNEAIEAHDAELLSSIKDTPGP